MTKRAKSHTIPELTVWFTAAEARLTMDEQEAQATLEYMFGCKPEVDFEPQLWYTGISLVELKQRMREVL